MAEFTRVMIYTVVVKERVHVYTQARQIRFSGDEPRRSSEFLPLNFYFACHSAILAVLDEIAKLIRAHVRAQA